MLCDGLQRRLLTHRAVYVADLEESLLGVDVLNRDHDEAFAGFKRLVQKFPEWPACAPIGFLIVGDRAQHFRLKHHRCGI